VGPPPGALPGWQGDLFVVLVRLVRLA